MEFGDTEIFETDFVEGGICLGCFGEGGLLLLVEDEELSASRAEEDIVFAGKVVQRDRSSEAGLVQVRDLPFEDSGISGAGGTDFEEAVGVGADIALPARPGTDLTVAGGLSQLEFR